MSSKSAPPRFRSGSLGGSLEGMPRTITSFSAAQTSLRSRCPSHCKHSAHPSCLARPLSSGDCLLGPCFRHLFQLFHVSVRSFGRAKTPISEKALRRPSKFAVLSGRRTKTAPTGPLINNICFKSGSVHRCTFDRTGPSVTTNTVGPVIGSKEAAHQPSRN
jgi:hypothetical protein